jgi:hypothetical protein
VAVFTLLIIVTVLLVSSQARAQSYTVDPGLVPALSLADCTPKAAIGQATYEAIKRQAALAEPTMKLLKEFEVLNNKTTSKGDEPMWKGLSTPDAIRASEISAKIAQLRGLSYSDSAYDRDLGVIDMMLSDALTEYSTTTPPVFEDTDPKSDEKVAYAVLLAMREGLDGGKDDPAPTPNQTVCSIDLAFYRATAAPMAKYNSFGAQAPQMQASMDRLKAKYGDKLDPVRMSADDTEAYTTISTFLASANRTRAYIGDLENLRMIAAASAIRREAHITDLLAGGTDTEFGATLKKRAANGEFNASMTKALFIQDKLSEFFPTEEIKALKAMDAADKPK